MSLWGEISLPKMELNKTCLASNKFNLEDSNSFIELKITILGNVSKRISGFKRIGPHNKYIMDLFIGSLLGDGSLEKHGSGSRFSFYQSSKARRGFLLWLHSKVAALGYCNDKIPDIKNKVE